MKPIHLVTLSVFLILGLFISYEINGLSISDEGIQGRVNILIAILLIFLVRVFHTKITKYLHFSILTIKNHTAAIVAGILLGILVS